MSLLLTRKRRIVSWLTFLFSLMISSVIAEDIRTDFDVDILLNHKIPMRDGISAYSGEREHPFRLIVNT